jgi:ABC-type lipoprotein release transport system permease subunit
MDFRSYSTVTSYMALIKDKIYPTWGIEKLAMRASVVAIISAVASVIPAIEAGRREPAEALHYV